jgi:hypothetical protein
MEGDGTCDYSAPPARQRLLMITRCDSWPVVWPEPTHAKPPTKDRQKWKANSLLSSLAELRKPHEMVRNRSDISLQAFLNLRNAIAGHLCESWRETRDSNPGNAINVRRFSRQLCKLQRAATLKDCGVPLLSNTDLAGDRILQEVRF